MNNSGKMQGYEHYNELDELWYIITFITYCWCKSHYDKSDVRRIVKLTLLYSDD